MKAQSYFSYIVYVVFLDFNVLDLISLQLYLHVILFSNFHTAYCIKETDFDVNVQFQIGVIHMCNIYVHAICNHLHVAPKYI